MKIKTALTVFLVILVALTTISASCSRPTQETLPTLLVVVNSGIHDLIQPEITQYRADLEDEGYTIQVISYSCEMPSQLRETIRNHDPDGVFLIGDFPVAWFEIYPYIMKVEYGTYEYPYHTIFPTDLYYMDLDGAWKDSNNNGYFDEHTGNVEPEIFFGRLTTSTLDLLGDEVEIIKNYLRRNHRYRTGATEMEDKALIYWCSEFDSGVRCREVLREVYAAVDVIDVRHIPGEGLDYQGGSKEDFLQKLQGGYQFVMLGGIGHNPSSAVNMRGDYLTCSDLTEINPQSQFYVLHSCLNARYIDNNFIAGCFAYGGEGLIAIGVSSGGGGIGKGPAFYESLQSGKSFGEAIKDFFIFMVSTDTPEQYSNHPRATHCYNTILLGDPTLKIRK